MVAGNLRTWLDGERDRLVWIEFDDYAHRVFANDAADWLDVANVFVSGVSQAQGVVATEVLSIDVLASYLWSVDGQSGVTVDGLQALLQLEAPKGFVNEVLDALAHRYANDVDLILKIDSPAQLLRRAGVTEAPTFDDLDDIGIALSNVLREFSTKPITGVLISSAESISDDEAEALESVVSAARHYEWRVALSLDGAAVVPSEIPEVDVDLVLLPGVAIAALAAPHELSLAVGGGLRAAYWEAGAEAPTAERCLLYGAIPAQTQPELVVQRVAAAFAK